MGELLRLDNVSAGYGEAVVLEDISLSLAEGDSLALLGRNGMGKTTLLVTLMGLTPAAPRRDPLARNRHRRAAHVPARPFRAGLGAAGALYVRLPYG